MFFYFEILFFQCSFFLFFLVDFSKRNLAVLLENICCVLKIFIYLFCYYVRKIDDYQVLANLAREDWHLFGINWLELIGVSRIHQPCFVT